ncbi:hypothetical protein QYF36_027062 [Acer negundo]|nr:hypothetical protein QYF36_027062 [Acer negundo]
MRGIVFPLSRPFSSDALVQLKPDEIGLVFGIPEQHLWKWKINFMSTQKWENPLMDWTSTSDPYANVGGVGFNFDSDAAAKEFAERHGWEYVIKKHHTPLLKVKSYAKNFKWKGLPKTDGN